jgi:predicted TPR repeat methyltransferase
MNKMLSHLDNQVESVLVTALMHDPENVVALMNMGRHFEAHDRDQEADGMYRTALAVQPDHPEALLALGRLLHLYPAFRDEAITFLQRTLEIDPSLTAAYAPLASSLKSVGRVEEGVAVLRAWVAAAPMDAVAMHILAASSHEDVPDRASDAFVTKTFDEGAERFDTLLRDTLQYRAPEVLSAHLHTMLTESGAGVTMQALDVLDVGCGTGLCAPLLRPLARRLVGVDLSGNMIEKARARGGYDLLETAELTGYLAAHTGEFDLLFSADTLCYFGRLAEVFAAAQASLRAGGWLAFTVERLLSTDDTANDTFTLAPTGRYQHAADYVRSALQHAGFAAPQMIHAQLRIELGHPVMGLAVVAQKPV